MTLAIGGLLGNHVLELGVRDRGVSKERDTVDPRVLAFSDGRCQLWEDDRITTGLASSSWSLGTQLLLEF